jgi:hypothetical protein
MIRANSQPCPVCTVRRAVYLVAWGDKAGDHPTPDLADLLHRMTDVQGVADRT